MDKIDVLLVAGAAYVAVVSLVRLMAARRDQVIRQLRAEIEKQRATSDDDDRDAA